MNSFPKCWIFLLLTYTNLPCEIQGIYFSLSNASNLKTVLGDQKIFIFLLLLAFYYYSAKRKLMQVKKSIGQGGT